MTLDAIPASWPLAATLAIGALWYMKLRRDRTLDRLREELRIEKQRYRQALAARMPAAVVRARYVGVRELEARIRKRGG